MFGLDCGAEICPLTSPRSTCRSPRSAEPIRTPRTLLLACAAIEAGIQPIE